MKSAPDYKARRTPFSVAALQRVSVVHRWLGMALCLMLALWFATGSILSFVPFPSLSTGARIAGSEPLDLRRLRVSPTAALTVAAGGDAVQLRLVKVLEEPRYLITAADGSVVAVSAITGQPLARLSAVGAISVAERFSQLTAMAVKGPMAYDQWTIHDKYPAQRPYYRVRMADPDATDLYVSARTGEVLQRTRRTERAWNRVGAVIHWLNVPALRIRANAWHWTIWTVALGAILLTLAGLTLGYWRLINHRRAGRSGLTPYRGLLRWHHGCGLVVGIIVLSWIGSGWMSLDQGTLFSSGWPSDVQTQRWRGMTLAAAATAMPLSLLQSLPPARELEFSALNGSPLIVARDLSPQSSTVYALQADGSVAPAPLLPDAALLAAARAAWAPLQPTGIAPIAADDNYRLRIDPPPDSARRISLNDPGDTWIQVDAADGQVLLVLDRSRRVYRWLVDGLHNFDFPIFNRGPLWHVLLLICTSTGFAFSCVGIVLAARRLQRALQAGS